MHNFLKLFSKMEWPYWLTAMHKTFDLVHLPNSCIGSVQMEQMSSALTWSWAFAKHYGV
jgi:hypothetical protein